MQKFTPWYLEPEPLQLLVRAAIEGVETRHCRKDYVLTSDRWIAFEGSIADRIKEIHGNMFLTMHRDELLARQADVYDSDILDFVVNGKSVSQRCVNRPTEVALVFEAIEAARRLAA